MDRWHWLWALGFLNTLLIAWLLWRTIQQRMRIDSLRNSFIYVVANHQGHVRDAAAHHACCGCIGEA